MLWFSLAALLLLMGSPVVAQQEVLSVDPDLPESWYGERPLASELGITEFSESPLLAERVEAGELPPVAERLPVDPPTIEPLSPGKYGGVAHVWSSGHDMGVDDGRMLAGLSGCYLLGRSTPDGRDTLPNLLLGWEYSDDATELTLFLREGVKWSDGHPFTTDDFLFWWNQVALNEDLEPVPPEDWEPGILEVSAADEYTVTFTYDRPVPVKHLAFHKGIGQRVLNHPAHFMKDYHPDFRDLDELVAEAEEHGMDYWDQYYEYMQSKNYPERGRPVMDPYVIVERAPTYADFERNPYYPFVDDQGNQLPYLDGVRLNIIADRAMKRVMAFEGAAAIAGPHLFGSDIPLYIDGEEEGDYTTYIWSSGKGSETALMPNLNHQDEAIREVLQDVRFRRALSVAMDRDEINRRLFHGMAEPRQSSLTSDSAYYREEYSQAWIQYDPELAEELLDDMGLVDQSGDGYRQLPDGERLFLEILFTDSPATPVLELAIEQFREVGLDIDLDMVSRDLMVERRNAADFDISEWHIDRVTDNYFPHDLGKTFAPTSSQMYSSWPLWVSWVTSAGRTGEEPPDDMKELLDWAREVFSNPDEEERDMYVHKLLQAQADNLWTIGTVGEAPSPVIVANNLHNVPRHGMLIDDVDWGSVYFPEQFYLDPQ